MGLVELTVQDREYIDSRQMVLGIINVTQHQGDEEDGNKMWQIMCGINIRDVSTLPTGIIMKFLEEFERKHPQLTEEESRIKNYIIEAFVGNKKEEK